MHAPISELLLWNYYILCDGPIHVLRHFDMKLGCTPLVQQDYGCILVIQVSENVIFESENYFRLLQL